VFQGGKLQVAGTQWCGTGQFSQSLLIPGTIFRDGCFGIRGLIFNNKSRNRKWFSFRLGKKEINMKKLLLACAVACAGFTAIAGTSYADVSEAMKNSKYCVDNSMDVICMGPEMMAMRTKMMEMNKEKAMEARTKYCEGGTGATDPICDPKMMKDATGY
jgi:hypothetical protein